MTTNAIDDKTDMRKLPIRHGYIANWHGGSSYSHSGRDHLEWFATIAEAKNAFRSRFECGYTWLQKFNYVEIVDNADTYFAFREMMPGFNYTPTVDENAYMDLWRIDPMTLSVNWDSFRRIEFGSRGGIIINIS